MKRMATALLLAATLAGPSCQPSPDAKPPASDSALLAEREARLDSALSRPDTGKSREKPIARWLLPKKLREISGLALTPDGRLFAHDDEVGRVFEIDYRRGAIVKDFLLGPLVRADFEGITVAGGSVYLLSSNGKLYEFKEGADRERVAYHVIDTGLGRQCEFEGVAFETASNSLLLACKNVWSKTLQGSLVIYRWKLGAGSQPQAAPLTVPLARVIGANRWRSLHPSDITIDPLSGNYVLVASVERALIELTPGGAVVFARPLPGHHSHAEGVAITKDHLLLISDEGRAQQAAIALYRWP